MCADGAVCVCVCRDACVSLTAAGVCCHDVGLSVLLHVGAAEVGRIGQQAALTPLLSSCRVASCRWSFPDMAHKQALQGTSVCTAKSKWNRSQLSVLLKAKWV